MEAERWTDGWRIVKGRGGAETAGELVGELVGLALFGEQAVALAGVESVGICDPFMVM